MIDIHAHFADEGYSFPQEWEKIRTAGVDTVILAGDTLAHSRWHRDFCAAHEHAYFCAGVHPSEIGGFCGETEQALLSLTRSAKCVAVGEIGLDYHYDPSEEEKRAQREVFLRQLVLACEAGLPVQIHSRDACLDTLTLLRENRTLLRGFVMHCYSYGKESMEAFLALGAYFSFGGVTCFRNARRVMESVEACPTERLLTETDSPYLSPFRGEKNTPANLPVILKRLAEIRQVSAEELEKQIGENALRLFPKLGGGV